MECYYEGEEMNLKVGNILKRKDKPNTYRVIEQMSGMYVYTRKPKRTPERLKLVNLSDKWEVVEHGIRK